MPSTLLIVSANFQLSSPQHANSFHFFTNVNTLFWQGRFVILSCFFFYYWSSSSNLKQYPTDDQAPGGKNEIKMFAITVPTDVFESDTILQLARKTLERAGIILYSFASCPETFVPYKKAYIDLLKMLQANGGQENIELRGINVLFTPYSRSTDLFSNLSKPRTDSDPAHPVELKFLYPEER